MRMAILALLLTSCAARDSLAFSYVGSDEGFAQASAAALEWRMTCGVDLTVARGGDGIPLEEVEPGSLSRPGLIVYGTTTLRGDTSHSGMGNFITQREKGYFIWSPNSTTTSTHATSDWTNGYQVSGLPASGIVFTRNTGAITEPQPTVFFSASPTTITLGQSSTLSWASTGTVNGGCYIFNGSGGASIIPFSATSGSGNITVSPTVSTTYRLWCTSNWKDGSPSAEKSVTVTVSQVTPLPPHSACPLLYYTPIICSGTTVPTYDANGCLIGLQCLSAPVLSPTQYGSSESVAQ